MTASSLPVPAVSPVDAARDAFDHTRRQLFPFRFEKWVLLGLLAFLDQCGRSLPGGGGSTGGGDGHGPRLPGGGLPGDAADLAALLERATAWLSAHAAAVALGSVFGLLPLLGLARVALRDFVAPLQLAGGLPCGAAARVLESLVLQHPGAFVLYLLLKLLLVVVAGLVIAVGGCLTCCLGFLPVVMQVVFQPLFFFERAFSLCLLRQMGHDVPARLAP